MVHCAATEIGDPHEHRDFEGDGNAACRRRSPQAGHFRDASLGRFLSEHAALTKPAQAAATLPVWHLGGAGTLHRRDIYADVG